MIAQNVQATSAMLACSVCGKTTPFRLPGVTKRTRYTCPQCCNRIAKERGDFTFEDVPSLLDSDPDVRRAERLYDGSGDSGNDVDDFA